MDARPDEMFMTRGEGERRRRGRSAVVRMAMEVMFVEKVWV